MLFNSIIFYLYFLPISLVIYYFFKIKNKNKISTYLLICFSLIFYSAWGLESTPILISSILINYFLIKKIVYELGNKWKRDIYFILGLNFNIILLFYFKYINFIIQNLNLFLEEKIPEQVLFLPLGISFFTFTQLALLVDAYRFQVKEINLKSHFLFVTFFPHLIAGPIYHNKEMSDQYNNIEFTSFEPKKIIIGLCVFAIGMMKKVLIADSLAVYVDKVYSSSNIVNISFMESWFGILAFLFQIYFDFSGYTDMALGLALMFNIKFPINFNSPFKAISIIDFWRRWHITLTRFLTEYIFIPLALSLNRFSEKKYWKKIAFITSIIIPVNITFFISGIWHGAGWNFILFGLINGMAVTINYIWQRLNMPKLPIFISWILTLGTFAISLVFFRSPNTEVAILILKGAFASSPLLFPSNIEINNKIIIEIINYIGITFNGSPLSFETPSKLFKIIMLCFFITILMPNTQQIFKKFSISLNTETKTKKTNIFFNLGENIINWVKNRNIIYISSIIRNIINKKIGCILIGIIFMLTLSTIVMKQVWLSNNIKTFLYFQF